MHTSCCKKHQVLRLYSLKEIEISGIITYKYLKLQLLQLKAVIDSCTAVPDVAGFFFVCEFVLYPKIKA